HGLAFGGRESVAHHARFERPLVAVEGGAPGVARVFSTHRGLLHVVGHTGGQVAPCAVGPDDVQVVVGEGGGLGVGDVRLAVAVNQDAAGGADGLWPTQAEHPTDHVEHVDAHVSDDAVAVFH